MSYRAALATLATQIECLRSHPTAALVDCLTTLAYRVYLYAPQSAIAHSREAQAVAQSLGDEGGYTFALLHEAIALLMLGAPARTDAILDQATRVSQKHGDLRLQGRVVALRSALAYVRGPISVALRESQQAQALLSQVNDWEGYAGAVALMAQGYLRVGEDSAALAALETAYPIFADAHDEPKLIYLLTLVAHATLRIGAPERGLDALATGFALAAEVGEDERLQGYVQTRLCTTRAALYNALGDLDRANADIQQAATAISKLLTYEAHPYLELYFCSTLSRIQAQRGDSAAALDMGQRALTLARQVRNPHEQADQHLWLSHLYKEGRNPKQAHLHDRAYHELAREA